MAISNHACESTIAMLHEGQPSADEARKVLRDLASLKGFSGIAEVLDIERVMYLDTIIELSRGNVDAESLRLTGQDRRMTYVRHFCIDWNVALRKGNDFYDRFVSAALLKDRAAREQALATIDAQVAQLEYNWSTNSLFTAVISPSIRTDMIASRFISNFLPALKTAFVTEDRANTTFDLTCLAAALAVYRAEHGAYPDELEALVPSALEKMPTDLYHAKPFLYNRIGDGYLLYSTGDNGQDNHGSNELMEIFEGQSCDDIDTSNSNQPATSQIPAGADDISIRVPRPKLKPPQPSNP